MKMVLMMMVSSYRENGGGDVDETGDDANER